MHPVTPLLPVSYLWLPKLPSSLFHSLLPFSLPLSSPSSIIPPTQAVSSLPPLWAEPSQASGPPWLHIPFKQCRVGKMSELWDVHANGQNWRRIPNSDRLCLCLCPPPPPPPPPTTIRGTLSCRQKQWIRLHSETMTEGLILKVFPLTVFFLPGEPLCDK